MSLLSNVKNIAKLWVLRNGLEVCTALKPMNYLLSSMQCTGFLRGAHWGGKGGVEGCETPLPISPRWGDCERHLFTGLSLLGTPQLPPGLRVGHISRLSERTGEYSKT